MQLFRRVCTRTGMESLETSGSSSPEAIGCQSRTSTITTVKIVGVADARGASPVHLKRSGFAEWLVSANPRSKVASVSGKDRGAIHPAAHAKSAYVYWFEGALGRFVTSTYYRKSDPAWVTAFHNDRLQKHRSETTWSLAAPVSALSRANPDTSANEADGVNTFFPHTFNAAAGSVPFWVWWENTSVRGCADTRDGGDDGDVARARPR